MPTWRLQASWTKKISWSSSQRVTCRRTRIFPKPKRTKSFCSTKTKKTMTKPCPSPSHPTLKSSKVNRFCAVSRFSPLNKIKTVTMFHAARKGKALMGGEAHLAVGGLRWVSFLKKILFRNPKLMKSKSHFWLKFPFPTKTSKNQTKTAAKLTIF